MIPHIPVNTKSPETDHHGSTTDTSNQTNNGGGILSGATDTFATAGETAKQYLPTSVVNTLQNVGVMAQDATTLPSQETRFSGSRGGIGTLPGRPSESEVAKLPEEKRLEEEVGHPLGREGVMGTDAEVKPMGLAESLELDHKKRAQIATAGTDTAAKFINLDAIPTPGETPGGDQTQHETEAHMNKPLPPSGNDTTYAQDQAKRQAAKTEPTAHTSPSVPRTDHKVHIEQKKDQRNADSTNDGKEKSKPSIGQKIKGGVKVLSGKLANDPSKVEAGQAMKKGTNT